MAVISIKNKTKSGSLLVGNAYYDPGNFKSIATANGTGSSGTITFSSIPATYTHLQIRGIGTSSAADDTLSVNFNSDTGANYAFHYIYADGATRVAGNGINKTSSNAFVVNFSSATPFGASVIDILDYANTSKYKTTRTLGGYDNNGSGQILFGSGLWMSTTAISTITLKVGGNLLTNSQFALYGIKGA